MALKVKCLFRHERIFFLNNDAVFFELQIMSTMSLLRRVIFHPASMINQIKWCSTVSNGLLELHTVKSHQKEGSLLVDVREPQELENHGLVPNAVNIPVGDVEAAFAMPKDDFKANLGIDKPSMNDPVVFFCVKGIRAKTAKDLVEQKGYKQSFYFPGSFTELQ